MTAPSAAIRATRACRGRGIPMHAHHVKPQTFEAIDRASFPARGRFFFGIQHCLGYASFS